MSSLRAGSICSGVATRRGFIQRPTWRRVCRMPDMHEEDLGEIGLLARAMAEIGGDRVGDGRLVFLGEPQQPVEAVHAGVAAGHHVGGERGALRVEAGAHPPDRRFHRGRARFRGGDVESGVHGISGD